MNSPLNLGKDWLLLTVNSMWGYRHLSPNTQRLYSGGNFGCCVGGHYVVDDACAFILCSLDCGFGMRFVGAV